MDKIKADEILNGLEIGDSFDNSVGNRTEIVDILNRNCNDRPFTHVLLKSETGTEWQVQHSTFKQRVIDGTYSDFTYKPKEINKCKLSEKAMNWQHNIKDNDIVNDIVKEQKIYIVNTEDPDFTTRISIFEVATISGEWIYGEVLKSNKAEKYSRWGITKDILRKLYKEGKLSLTPFKQSNLNKLTNHEKSRTIKTEQGINRVIQTGISSGGGQIATTTRLVGNKIFGKNVRGKISGIQVRKSTFSF